MVNENNKRYFFFVYSYYAKEVQGKGNIYFEASGFVSKKEVTKHIVNKLKNRYNLSEDSFSIIIENWIELSEEDYNEWIS